MIKEDLKELKRNVKKNLLKKNLFLSCIITLLKYFSQASFLFFLLLLVISLTDLTGIESFIPKFLFQLENSYKHIFIIFLSPIVLLMYLLTFFLKLGIKRWYYLLTKDSTISFLEIFYYYNEKKAMISALKLKLFTMLRLTFESIKLLFPPLFLFAFFSIQMQICASEIKVLFAFFMIISMLIFLINTVYFIKTIIVCKLYQAVFFENGITNFSKELKKIKLIFKKNKLDFLKFLASLSSCFFSCIFILPLIIAVPYFYMMIYSYTNFMIKQNNGRILEPKNKFFYIDINTELDF